MSNEKRMTDIPVRRFVCTAESPWSRSVTGQTTHPDALDDGECSDQCCDYYRCPHCGLRFRVEVGQ